MIGSLITRASDRNLTRYFVRVSLVLQYGFQNEKERVLGAHIGVIHASIHCCYLRSKPAEATEIVTISGPWVDLLPHCKKCWRDVR